MDNTGLIKNQNNKTNIKHVTYNKSDFLVTDNLVHKEGFINWTIFTNLTDTFTINEICLKNNVDELIIEDILHVNQRNKIHLKSDYAFCVLKSSYMKHNIINHDYISMILFKDKLFTFHEYNSHLFDSLLKRIENNKGLIRKKGHDYLFYAILDLIVDNNTEVYNHLSLKTIELEDTILNNQDANQKLLYHSRKELLYLKNNTMFFTDLFSKKFFQSTDLINDNIDKYFEDLHDHIVRLNENINTEREIIRNLLDMHMNNVSNKMNSVMKTLTIFSAIFIPLTFLTGYFGMNFKEFPSLYYKNGIPIFIATCVVIAVGMIIFFKKRKWF